MPNYDIGRCLRRALDKKMHALRMMMSADEDITTELDRVVCRLMKLALRTSKGKQTPPPTRWMQCKLLDLLTLTEKAISRRRKLYIESFPVKAIGDGHEQTQQFLILEKIRRENRTAESIVYKYNHLVEAIENRQLFDPFSFGFEDEMGDQDEYGLDTSDITNSLQPEALIDNINITVKKTKSPTSWVDEDNLEIVPYPVHNAKSPMVLSDHSTSNGEWKRYKKVRPKTEGGDKKAHKRSYSKVSNEKLKLDDKYKSKKIKTLAKKVMRNTSTSFTTIARIRPKKYTEDFGNYALKAKRSKKNHKKITNSNFQLRQPEFNTQDYGKEFVCFVTDKKEDLAKSKPCTQVADTEETVLIEIITDDTEETIALRRSIGTDADMQSSAYDEELVIGNVTNIANDDSHSKLQVASENVQSQTFFLYDINEPSTSKGVRRHVSMDVQCGTDLITPACGLLTPPASVTRMPNLFNNGIRIGDSLTNMLSKRNSLDFRSPTNNAQNFGPVRSRIRSPIFGKGIRIEDSLDSIAVKKKSHDFGTGTSNNRDVEGRDVSPVTRTTRIRIKDSLSEVRAKRSSDFGTSTNENTLKMKSFSMMTETVREKSPRKRSPATRSIGIKIRDSTCELGQRINFNISTGTNISEESKLDSPYVFTGTTNDFQSSYNEPTNDQPQRVKHASPTRRQTVCDQHVGVGNTSIKLENDQHITGKTENSYKKEPKSVSGSMSPTFFLEGNMMDYITAPPEEPNSDVDNSTLDVSEYCRIVAPRVKSPVIFRTKSKTLDCATCTNITNIFSNNDKVNIDTGSNILKYKSFQFDGIDIETEKHRSINSSTNYETKEVACNEEIECPDQQTPGVRNIGLRVKSTNPNVTKKVEFATTRVKLLSSCHPIQPKNQESLTKTECIKPVSSPMKTEDSFSDIYGTNYCSSQKSFLHATNSFSNTTEESRETSRRECSSPTKMMGRRLSCGGIHLHSYKDKERSEDIVFQGEWQRQIPKDSRKHVAKKVPQICTKKSYFKKTDSNEKNQTRKIDKKYEVKLEQKKPMHVRNTKSIKPKQEFLNKTEQLRKVTLPNIAKAIKANTKNLTKVSSKIGMNSITSKNFRNTRSNKRPINVVQTSVKRDCDVRTDSIKRKDILKKNYLPPYLKKRKLFMEQNLLNMSLDSVTTTILCKNVDDDQFRTNAIDIKDLVRLQNEPHDDVSYTVFRNELDNSNVGANSKPESSDNATVAGNVALSKRSSSPISQNSSTCSTSQSIATVRTMSTWSRGSRLHSTSSNKSSIGFTDSETTPPTKTRKFSKRSKVVKKDDHDKENVPESSKKGRLDKGGFLNLKNAFKNRKSVFVTQFSTDSGVALTTKAPTKSNVKIPVIGSTGEIKRSKSANISKKKSLQSHDSSANISKKKSMQSHDSSYTDEIKKQDSLNSVHSNKVLLLEPQKQVQDTISPPKSPEEPIIKVVDSCLLTEWLESGNMSAMDRESTENAILSAMRQIVEERLALVGFLENDSAVMDSANLSLDESRELDDNSSLKSFKTVVHMTDADFNKKITTEIESLNNTFETFSLDDTGTSELDLLSFKSVTSASRYSEYFSADNEQNKIEEQEAVIVNSVRDIFERKDLNVMQNPAQIGPLAVQAFSGFSMNAEPLVGDQPDYVNLIDSETGSIAMEMARQATSEELFVSGRSSESYESCIIDEDAVVPNWLFHIISHQQSVDEEEENGQELIPLPMPLVEPRFDLNGNVAEPGVGMGAGAGDGRGIHSDHSQDSSGRGSSLSSTETSSGQQSEAILIDPSAFAAQFELVHEPITSSVAVTTLVVPIDVPDRHGNNELGTSRMEPRPLLLTSDGDADVSSLDTDLPDSSDN